MKTLSLALVLAFAVVLPAHAEDEEAERFGEVHVKLVNAEFCKVQINGADWTGTEFERRGKLLLIKGLPLAEERFEVTLEPFNESLEPVTFTVVDVPGDRKKTDFKRTRKGRFYYFIANKTVKFDKRKVDEPAPTPEPDEPNPGPEPEPDPDTDL